MPLQFEWDGIKARANAAKHSVSFDNATSVFGDRLSLTIANPAHSSIEERFITLGRSHRQRLLVVVYTERGDHIRIISARRASKRVRKDYEKTI